MSWVAGLALVQTFVTSGGPQEPVRNPRPDTVLIATAGDFAARFDWAEQTARQNRYGEYWIGWAIGGDATGTRWLYVDRAARDGERRQSFGGWSVSGSAGGLSFNGEALPALTGSRDAHDVAVLIRYGGGSPVRVHVGSYAFPFVFDGGALLWLGNATDAESVSRTRSAFGAASDDEVRAGLVAAAGAARDPASAAPVLRAWLDDQRLASAIRREAANWLALHPHDDNVATLTRAARNDTSRSVRAAAIRAIARSAQPASAVDVLGRLGREDPDPRIRREAVAALGSVRDDRAFRALVDLVERPGDSTQSAVRGQAMLTLAQQAQRPGSQATVETLRLFERVARTDPDTSVELRAVDALIALRDARATPILIDLANTHANGRLQQKAVQALARAEPRQDAIQALRRLANEHPRPETQRMAVRAMAQIREPGMRDILAELAERHPRPDVRKAALDALVQLHR